MNIKSLIFLFILCSSCSVVYKYNSYEYGDGFSGIIINHHKTFYEFSPKWVTYDYDYDYEEIERYGYDTVIYKKEVYKHSKGTKLKFKNSSKNFLVYRIKNREKNTLLIPTTINDTIINNYFLPRILYDSGSRRSLCSLDKYLPHTQSKEKYQYTFVKDTLIHSPLGMNTCVLINVVLKNDRGPDFFNAYPIQIYLIKETGIPLSVNYPFCSISDTLNGNDGVDYHEVNMTDYRKFLFLNKRHLF